MISSCTHCGAALGYAYPDHRYTAVYCTPACAQAATAAAVDDSRLVEAVTA